MAFICTIMTEHSLMLVHGSGILKPDEIITAMRDIRERPEYEPDMDRLVIFDDNASMSEIDIAAISKIKDIDPERTVQAIDPTNQPFPFSPTPYRIAFICNNQMNLNLVRLYEGMIKANQKVDVEINYFETVDNALGWLGKKNVTMPALL